MRHQAEPCANRGRPPRRIDLTSHQTRSASTSSRRNKRPSRKRETGRSMEPTPLGEPQGSPEAESADLGPGEPPSRQPSPTLLLWPTRGGRFPREHRWRPRPLIPQAQASHARRHVVAVSRRGAFRHSRHECDRTHAALLRREIRQERQRLQAYDPARPVEHGRGPQALLSPSRHQLVHCLRSPPADADPEAAGAWTQSDRYGETPMTALERATPFTAAASSMPHCTQACAPEGVPAGRMKRNLIVPAASVMPKVGG